MQVRQVPLRHELGQLLPPISSEINKGSLDQASTCTVSGSVRAVKRVGVLDWVIIFQDGDFKGTVGKASRRAGLSGCEHSYAQGNPQFSGVTLAFNFKFSACHDSFIFASTNFSLIGKRAACHGGEFWY